MAEKEPAPQPIVIKRVKKHGGHHGGAWKVALADFVTAMMAFFLLMWLMGSTTPEQRAGIADFFNNPSLEPGTSPVPSQTHGPGPGGASTSLIQLGGALDLPTAAPRARVPGPAGPGGEAAERERDQRRLEELLQELNAAVEKSQALRPFKDQLLLDIAPEGLRIQLVDKENRPMFDVGSARLKDYTAALLGEIARFINQVPNRISITGHTDARPYLSEQGYSNWELSSERANSARRALVAAGMNPEKIGRVVGLASSVLFDKADPFSPLNRRISIIVMNREAEADLREREGPATVAEAPVVEPVPASVAPAAPPPLPDAGDFR